MAHTATVIDCDMHLYEPRDMWSRYGAGEHALQLTDDALGHTWLTHHGRQLHIAEVHHPGDVAAMGEYRQLVRSGKPVDLPYDEKLPRDFTDPTARLARLDDLGIAEAVLFPNFGLLWERPLSTHLPALHANMAAWNRYAAEVAADAGGRLHPVAHLSLRDPEWLEDQLGRLATAGIRLAMVAPALVGGKPFSHPEMHRVWSAFEHHGIAPVFHVSAFPHPFHDEWYEGDADWVSPVLSSVFLYDAAALCLADMAIHGTFDQHPDLRIGVMELSAVWVPMFLLFLDGGFGFHARFNGEPLTRLALRPSEYVTRQVRVAAFSYELPMRLIEQAGDLFMACSDYPHAEGTASPVTDYRTTCGDPATLTGLMRDNVSWLLGR